MVSHLWTWIVSNWIALGLTLSELLALFPGKYNGIIQTVWKLLTGFVGTKQ
jgi:hypothetical protein